MSNVFDHPTNKLSIAEILEGQALARKLTTFSTYSGKSNGTLVWVSGRELDPVTALMKAAVSILIRRGNYVEGGPISIRKLTNIVAPGCDYHWQVTDGSGNVLHSGYAKDEGEAAEKISECMRISLDPPKPTT